mmetsp:Transcript_2021/g.3053  ORF Transcript_2021/g.3053 Transcript_2021/m.3053 type:complete len:295 (+) Transcript_2021:55-939(+)
MSQQKSFIKFNVIGLNTQRNNSVIVKNIKNIEINLKNLNMYINNLYNSRIHKNIKYNNSGNQVSAKSWGPGRGLARIPRIKGSGTRKAGQGALANMCRGGRLFGNRNYSKKWNIKTNRKVKVSAFKTALLSTLFETLVVSRGHSLKDVKNFPMIIDSILKYIWHPRELLMLLKLYGGYSDFKKAMISHAKRKKHLASSNTCKNGPLIIVDQVGDLFYLTQNTAGLEVCCFSKISIQKFILGGRIGRFCIFSKRSFLSMIGMLDCFKIESSYGLNSIPKSLNLRLNKETKRILIC